MTSAAAQLIPGAPPPLSPPRIPLDIWTLIFEELLDQYQLDYDTQARLALVGATRLCKELQAEAERYLYRVVGLKAQWIWKFEMFQEAVRMCPTRRAGAIRDLSLVFWTSLRFGCTEHIPRLGEFLNEEFEYEGGAGEKTSIELHALTIPLELAIQLHYETEDPDSLEVSAKPIRAFSKLKSLTMNIGASSWKPWKLDHLSLYHATLTHLRLDVIADPIPVCTIPSPVRKHLVSLIITLYGYYGLPRFWPPGDLLKVDGGATKLVNDMPKLEYLELDESTYVTDVHSMASSQESCIDFMWPIRCSNLKVLVWRASPVHNDIVRDAFRSGYEDRGEAFRRNHDKYIDGTFEHFPKLERLERTKFPHELEDPSPYRIFRREQGPILDRTRASSRPDDSEAAEGVQAHADD
ncbi:hypothetical protein K466DRAFT_666999 [Polyporus arcularius HHB13444]|uniref:Uncharacterized protein n=1 Tax=Polyporus arcularius HHB13444 TaxID=1314778 RepID=A0A5C3NVW9_9APHY|nr:hypothetical protein K466DRAFT_666999 [Polyporus arcularius HHB13444]